MEPPLPLNKQPQHGTSVESRLDQAPRGFVPILSTIRCVRYIYTGVQGLFAGKRGRSPMEDGLTHEVLIAQGYRLIDDVWGARGRRTYIHGEGASAGTSSVWLELSDVSDGKRTRINCGRFSKVALMRLLRWSPVVLTRRDTFYII
jgi:hypothetical protein